MISLQPQSACDDPFEYNFADSSEAVPHAKKAAASANYLYATSC